jgi:hypothetical protein
MPGETLLKSPETARLPRISSPVTGQAAENYETAPQSLVPPTLTAWQDWANRCLIFHIRMCKGMDGRLRPNPRKIAKNASAVRFSVAISPVAAGYLTVLPITPIFPLVRTTGVILTAEPAARRRADPPETARRWRPVSVRQHPAVQSALAAARPVALTGWKLQISGSLR